MIATRKSPWPRVYSAHGRMPAMTGGPTASKKNSLRKFEDRSNHHAGGRPTAAAAGARAGPTSVSERRPITDRLVATPMPISARPTSAIRPSSLISIRPALISIRPALLSFDTSGVVWDFAIAEPPPMEPPKTAKPMNAHNTMRAVMIPRSPFVIVRLLRRAVHSDSHFGKCGATSAPARARESR